MSDAIELLTSDDDGKAVQGPICPRDRGTAVAWMGSGGETRIAYLHKFFLRDDEGSPRPETLTEFYVRDYHCDGAAPSATALDLAAQRIQARESVR